MSIAIASIGELLVEFVCADKGGRHRRLGTYSGPYPSGAPGIFIDQAARCGGRAIFVGAVGQRRLRRGHPGAASRRRRRRQPDRRSSRFADRQRLRQLQRRRQPRLRLQHRAFGRRAICRRRGGRRTAAGLRHGSRPCLGIGPVERGDGRKDAAAVQGAARAAACAVSFDPNIRKELIGSPSYFATVNELVDISQLFPAQRGRCGGAVSGRGAGDLCGKAVRQGRPLRRAEAGRQGRGRNSSRRRAPQRCGAQRERRRSDRRRRLFLRHLRHADRLGLCLSRSAGARQRRGRAGGHQGRADGRQQPARRLQAWLAARS